MSKDLSNPINEVSTVKETDFLEAVKHDYWICCLSREASLIARKEVLTGKAKFGIIGDGKEVPQVAMARAFQKGDFRSGYYRDQTFMMALGECTLSAFFAQLYADTENDPFSGGRQMNNHYATPFVDNEGNWLDQTDKYNVSSDISSTGGQMARAMGLAYASKKYKALDIADNKFSKRGNEVSFVTIGDASTSEGIFWETMNAASVTKVPLVVCVWDDGYGISVPIDFQTTKKSISKALAGFQLDENGDGIYIYTVKAWDYPALIETFEKAVKRTRKNHIPALIHVQEVTQPQGHSTSGSHERYKSKERLEFEKDYDCIARMKQWMIETGISTKEELDALEDKAKAEVKEARKQAWDAYCAPSQVLFNEVMSICETIPAQVGADHKVHHFLEELRSQKSPLYSEIVKSVRQIFFSIIDSDIDAKTKLKSWLADRYSEADERFHTNLYSESPYSALKVKEVPAVFSSDSAVKNGYEVLNSFFDIALEIYPELLAFGEDVGQIGDVNQGFAGLQAKYGKDRVFDTGIREWTIMGQAIGLSMRGFRPIAEIQYLDYLIYGL
ncbi:MAG TPA: thiamine pyrophosphate-dependent enzyme, partial [Saprospiraceae bacterium]|nr:thiamine pyrophosphate-dependent enzyme [Saprospiraceae bacterium]